MKHINWKIWGITCAVTLLPILFGLALWNKLPDTLAIHFDINNTPDNFASKGFVVFGLPLLMVVLQTICCIANDTNAKKFGEKRKLSIATKWVIPVISIVLQAVTLAYGLGMQIDMRKFAMAIVGCEFLVIGNYLPKLDYIKNYKLEKEKARKINRFVGFETVIMGLLGLVTIFLPPVFSVLWLVLLIPYTIVTVIYGIKVGKKNKEGI